MFNRSAVGSSWKEYVMLEICNGESETGREKSLGSWQLSLSVGSLFRLVLSFLRSSWWHRRSSTELYATLLPVLLASYTEGEPYAGRNFCVFL